MLASRGERVPTGADWVHEVKWDGIRALVRVDRRGVRVFTRTGRDVSLAFPEVQELAGLGRSMVLDGEIVSLGSGVPTLMGLADRIHVASAAKAAAMARANPATLLIFDLLELDGTDLTGRTWQQRRDALEGLGLADVAWQVPAVHDDGPALMAATRQQGLEGVVSKRRGSTYAPGSRSRDWLKFPHRPTGSFVVGGFRHETDSEVRVGSLFLGVPTPAGLAYRGRVGSGVAGKSERLLREVLGGLVRPDSPFVAVPRLDAVGAVWTEPALVVDVEYLMLTADQKLRQPVFRGIRSDLRPEDLAELGEEAE